MNDAPTSFKPDPDFRKNLFETLRELEQNPSGNERARKNLRTWMSAGTTAADSGHLELHTLRVLAEKRRRHPDSFRLPEHLLECPACMEVFQVLCQDIADAAPPAASGRQSGRTETTRTFRIPRPGLRGGIWAAGAAVLLISLLLWSWLRPTGVLIESGSLRAREETLQDGPLPSRVVMESLRQTRLRFLDGSSIVLEPGARVRAGRSAGFSPWLELENGTAEFDFRDLRTAPEIRAPGLRIPPARAEVQLEITEPGLILHVTRGELHFTHADAENKSLSAGKSISLP